MMSSFDFNQTPQIARKLCRTSSDHTDKHRAFGNDQGFTELANTESAWLYPAVTVMVTIAAPGSAIEVWHVPTRSQD